MFPRQPLFAAARAQTRGRRPAPSFAVRTPTTATVPSSSGSGSGSSSASEAESASASASASATASAVEERWFHVNRSEGGKLPVYSKIRNGGNVTTIVRKVDGDATTLQRQLTGYLASLHIDPFTHPPKVTLRPTNQHLQIKGHWVDEVKGYLEGRGF